MAILVVGIESPLDHTSSAPCRAAGRLDQHARFGAHHEWRPLLLSPTGRDAAIDLERDLQRIRPEAIVLIGVDADVRMVEELRALGPEASLLEPFLTRPLDSVTSWSEGLLAGRTGVEARDLSALTGETIPAREAHAILTALMNWARPMNVPVLLIHSPFCGLHEAASNRALSLIENLEQNLQHAKHAVADWSL